MVDMIRCRWNILLFLVTLLPWEVQGQDAGNVAATSPHAAILYETAVQKTDRAFVEMARRGAEQARKDFGIKFSEYTIGIPENREEKLRSIADTGASMIIAVGFENVAPVIHLADRYPHTHFVVIDGIVPPFFHNVQSLIFKDHEGAFLVGMVAAMKTRSGIIGFVGGMDVPLIRNFAYGYEQGAHYVSRDVKVLHAMIGDTRDAWSNPARGAALAKAQFEDGADVVFAAAGGSSLGVLAAAHDTGHFAIGIDTNQNGLYPGTVLTSLIKRVDLAVYNTLKLSQNSPWSPGTKYLSATEGFLDYAVDNNNRRLISKEMIDRIETTKDLIFRGVLKVEAYTPN
jgi:basic membrane protein A and related proteins